MTRDWKQWLRLILAALFAPILAAAIAAAILGMLILPEHVFQVMIDSGEERPATLPEIMAVLFGFGAMGAMLGVILGWPAMLLAGLPSHRWLVGKGRTDWLPYALIGIPIGTLTMLVYFLGTSSLRDPASVLHYAGPLFLSGPLTGFLAASFFWLVRLPGRIPAP